MKTKHLMITMVLATGMLFGACGSNEPAESAAEEMPTEEMATEEMATEETAEINTTHAYVCPMNCENSASHEPGQCPVCGMDLAVNENFAGATDQPATEEDSQPVEGGETTE